MILEHEPQIKPPVAAWSLAWSISQPSGCPNTNLKLLKDLIRSDGVARCPLPVGAVASTAYAEYLGSSYAYGKVGRRAPVLRFCAPDRRSQMPHDVRATQGQFTQPAFFAKS